jgi:hypothetical protein
VLIGRLAEAGGRTLGITVGDAKRRKTERELDAQAEVLHKVMAIAKDHGVVPNLHNHIFEVADREYDLKGTLERVPEAKLGPGLRLAGRGGHRPRGFHPALRRSHCLRPYSRPEERWGLGRGCRRGRYQFCGDRRCTPAGAFQRGPGHRTGTSSWTPPNAPAARKLQAKPRVRPPCDGLLSAGSVSS